VDQFYKYLGLFHLSPVHDWNSSSEYHTVPEGLLVDVVEFNQGGDLQYLDNSFSCGVKNGSHSELFAR